MCFFRYGKTPWGPQMKWGGQTLLFPGWGWETVSTKACPEVGTWVEGAWWASQRSGGEVEGRWNPGSSRVPGNQMDGQQGDCSWVLENVCTLSPYTWILNHGFIFLLQKIVLKVRENKWVNFPRWCILGLGTDSTSAWPQISGWAPVTEETWPFCNCFTISIKSSIFCEDLACPVERKPNM